MLIALLIVISTLCCFYVKKNYNYWPSRGVPVPPYLPLLGHVYPLFFRGHRWEYTDKLYKEYKDEKFWGMYELLSPELHVKDPDLLRDILVKDADHFVDRRPIVFNEKDKLFTKMLLFTTGEEWKVLRSLMTPTFSSGKLKGMFPLIMSFADNFVTKCNLEVLKNTCVNINFIIGEFTMDVMTSCAFGIESNCLLGEKSVFAHTAENINIEYLTLYGMLKVSFAAAFPNLFNALGLTITTDSITFFLSVIQYTIKARKKSGKRRGDFLDILLEAQEENKKSKQGNNNIMTDDTVMAESLLFLIAGFDTIHHSLFFLTHLLAKNPECQAKLRKELQKIEEADGGFTYENIMEAPYLEACISESLRLLPVVYLLERTCTSDYRIPGTEIDIKKSMIVSVPIWSLHYDPKYWDDPNKFDPERFLPENKHKILPFTYLPFGRGPRNCIGMRFALMEAKAAIAKLCLNFELSVKPGSEEMLLSSSPLTLRPEKGFNYLIIKKIK